MKKLMITAALLAAFTVSSLATGFPPQDTTRTRQDTTKTQKHKKTADKKGKKNKKWSKQDSIKNRTDTTVRPKP